MTKDKQAGVMEEPLAKKLCGACIQALSKDKFSKKQWQQKQRRRCKNCVDSGQEIDVTKLNAALTSGKTAEEPSTTTNDNATANHTASNNNGKTADNNSNKKKGSKKRDTSVKQPVFAGNLQGRFNPSTNTSTNFQMELDTTRVFDGHVQMKLGYEICSWCGKAEEETKELMACSGCKNVLYCSRVCQKAAYPQHKGVCEQMKQDRKESKQERKAMKRGAYTGSEASGVGSFFIEYQPDNISWFITNGELRGGEEPGLYFATEALRQTMKRMMGPQKFKIFTSHLEEEYAGTFKRHEMFSSVDDLTPIDQFLFSCGPLDDIKRAKKVLPHVLHLISISGLKPDGTVPNIGDITVRGYALNALEWAARRGNYSIAEWLATDSRTKVMLDRADSAPVAWACYTNKVELAKMLVRHGANSHTTTEVVFGHKPPCHLASENGQLLALKYLVEECGHDIHECDTEGQDIRVSLRRYNKAWTSVAGCIACDDYAKSKGVLGEMSTTTKKKAKTAAKAKSQKQALDKLTAALKQLELVGGKEEDSEDDNDEDDEQEDNNIGDYLNEFLAVADARYELGQYSKAANLYYRGYYAAMHNGINSPTIFPIAHKLIEACIKTDEEHYIDQAHGMAQQNTMMPFHPPYIREDLLEVERVMRKKGMEIQRFNLGGMGF